VSDAPITGRVVSVHVGRVAPLGPEAEPSGFVKHAVAGPVAVGRLGLAGDEQADLRVHGGPDKAVYGYAISHYAAWAAEFPQHAALFVPGGVGENLAIAGMVEADICVGDVHAVGSALLQACQPRQPCFKFALRFENNRLPKAMVRSGRSGWYYRVLQTGTVAAGDTVMLHARPNPDFPFVRLLAVINLGDASIEELARMAEMPGLADQWQAHARKMLQQGRSAP
jgi:MOSC domain-containing protein YiiM